MTQEKAENILDSLLMEKSYEGDVIVYNLGDRDFLLLGENYLFLSSNGEEISIDLNEIERILFHRNSLEVVTFLSGGERKIYAIHVTPLKAVAKSLKEERDTVPVSKRSLAEVIRVFNNYDTDRDVKLGIDWAMSTLFGESWSEV